MVSDILRPVLQSLHGPALILSSSRTIVAVNDGLCRLSGYPLRGSLIGREFCEPDFELMPSSRARFGNFDAFFAMYACDEQNIVASDINLRAPSRADPSGCPTQRFWDEEDHNLTGSIDIKIRQGDTPFEINGQEVQACMSINRFWFEGCPLYIASFRRPMLRYPLSRELSPTSQLAETQTNLHSSIVTDLEGLVLAPNCKEREAQVHEVVSIAIPYFTVIFAADGRAIHFSNSWYHVTGMSDKETLDKGWFRAIHPDDLPAMMGAWTEFIECQAESWTWESRYQKSDGTYKWFLVRLEAARGAPGDTKYWYGSMMDVDVLSRAKQRSENRRNSVMKLISHTDICLWGLNEDRVVTLQEGALAWNPITTATRRGGIVRSNEARCMTTPPTTLFTDVADIIQETLAGCSTTRTLEHQDAQRWYRSTIIADPQSFGPHSYRSQGPQGVLGLTIDITDVRARAELEARNQVLVEKEQAARVAGELKSRFVANVSHELRTPIAGIIGMNDLLRPALSDKEQQNFSDTIRSCAAQLLTLINDVLDFSKIEAGHLKIETVPFRICELVENVQRIMAVQAEHKGLTIVCKSDDRLKVLPVVGDPNRLQQILLNLLSNSVKFTTSGSVSLEAALNLPAAATEAPALPSQPDQEVPTAVVWQHPANDQAVKVQFVVEDTGCGMSEATIGKLFEAFSQADSSTARKYGGTGLGLTISHQLITMMNGSIKFSSQINSGTKAVVLIDLPKAPQGAEEVSLSSPNPPLASALHGDLADETVDHISSIAARTPRREPAENHHTGLIQAHRASSCLSIPDGDAKLVLIVDDNAVTLKIASLMVQSLGQHIITAQNGDEALDILESRAASARDCPDVILMDCMMPILDGYETTKKLRQDASRFPFVLRTIPIIALTASAHEHDRKKCLEAGMNDYLLKPVNKTRLERTIRRWTTVRQQEKDQWPVMDVAKNV